VKTQDPIFGGDIVTQANGRSTVFNNVLKSEDPQKATVIATKE